MRRQEKVETNIYRRSGPRGVVYRVWMRNRGKVYDQTVDTLDQARNLREKLRQERHDSRQSPPADVLTGTTSTYARWWDLWWPVKAIELAPGTRGSYLSLARKHVLPRFGEMLLGDIKVSTVLAARTEMDASTSRATTDKALVNVLGASLTAAVVDEIIPVNPVSQMPRRRGRQEVSKRESKHLSVAEVLALADAIGPWYSTMVRFKAETGLRIGELAALRVHDLDLPGGCVRVEHSLPKLTRELGPPKTEAGYREVPLVRPVMAALLTELIEERGLSSESFVFRGLRGGKLDQDTFRERHFRPAVIKAGLGDRTYRRQHVTPHWLRHTAITNMVVMGLSPMEVAAIAGHRDSRVTEAIYTHLNPADMSHARVALQNHWDGATRPDTEGAAGTAV